jgi:hypothetical protein
MAMRRYLLVLDMLALDEELDRDRSAISSRSKNSSPVALRFCP